MMSNTAERLAEALISASRASRGASPSTSTSTSIDEKPLRTSGSIPSTPRTSILPRTTVSILDSSMPRFAAVVATPAAMQAARAWSTYSWGVGPWP